MYIITERLTELRPTYNDPLAQAVKRHAGVYDLRDAHQEGLIVTSSKNIKMLRRYQALYNTRFVLDMPAIKLDTQTMHGIMRQATSK